MTSNENHDDNDKDCSSCEIDVFKEKKPVFWKKVVVILALGVIFSIGLYLEFATKHKFVAQIIFLVIVSLSGIEIIKNNYL